MSTDTVVAKSPFDAIKWILVVLLIAASVVGYYLYSQQYVLYSVLATVGLCLLAAAVASTTVKGKSFLVLLREANIERRKVVWPTRQETGQTTLIVVVVVLLMGVFLWGVDSSLSWVISRLIG